MRAIQIFALVLLVAGCTITAPGITNDAPIMAATTASSAPAPADVGTGIAGKPCVGRHVAFTLLDPDLQAPWDTCDWMVGERCPEYPSVRPKSGIWQVIAYDLKLKDPSDLAKKEGGWEISLVFEDDETVTVNGKREENKPAFAKNRWSKEFNSIHIEECHVYRTDTPGDGTANLLLIPSTRSETEMVQSGGGVQMMLKWVRHVEALASHVASPEVAFDMATATPTPKLEPFATPLPTSDPTIAPATEVTAAPLSSGCGPGQIYVSGYYRKNGTYVRGYCRRK